MTSPESLTSDHALLAPHDAPEHVLPRPGLARWQPLRLGLVDLFYYDDEQFWFHDGRLLLRGNNGTGKSKVLALTLPFLLDGSLHSRRVEPDADPKKRMEWNLLLGGAHPGSERTGYAWVEFGRQDADGTEHFTTLGMGLKAAAGRGMVKHWYFVTPRRIGDLHLVDAKRVPLTQERLRDELGSERVFTSKEAYRRTVDEALFRLGEERYAALIDLLIQLRQPQLSKRPDEKALSAALTEALAPLDQAVIADVAESFRSLEDERSGIAAAKETLGATEAFLKHYRDYAKVAARRHTTAVRKANSSYEEAGRHLREAETALGKAVELLERLDIEAKAAAERRSALEGRQQALRESPEMRDADRLDRAEEAAKDMEQRTAEATAEAERAATRAAREQAIEVGARQGRDTAAADRQQRSSDAERLAGVAGLADAHPDLVSGEPAVRRAIARRREQIKHVQRLVTTAASLRDTAGHRAAELDRAEGSVSAREEEAQGAEHAVESAIKAHSDGVRAYLAGLGAMVIDTDVDELIARAEGWARNQEAASPAKAAVEAATMHARERLGRQRADVEQELQRIAGEWHDVRSEIDAIEAGHDPAPAPAPARSRQSRDALSGAPLWRLTDFAEQVPAADRAGIEAALHSAGLLDAWVFPDGTVAAEGEVVLGPSGAEANRSLAEVLVPAIGPDTEASVEAVAGVLARLGLGEQSGAPLWVDAAGRWGAGPARGAWSKAEPEHIGAGAREASRQRRLAELREVEERLDGRKGEGEARLSALAAGTANLLEEFGRYPSATEQHLAATHARAASAHQEASRAREEAEEARLRKHEADASSLAAEDELTEQAQQLRLDTRPDELDKASNALADYDRAMVELRNASSVLAERQEALEQAESRVREATAQHEARLATGDALRERATGLRARFTALHVTVGASVAELQAQLGQVADDLRTVNGSLQEINQRQRLAVGEQGRLEQKVIDLGERREEMVAAREIQVAALRDFSATGLLRVAVPEEDVAGHEAAEEWHVTAALTLARSVEQRLQDTDESDDAWTSSQQRVSTASTELATQMSRHGHTASIEQRGDVLLARVHYLSEELDIDRLALRLGEDVADRERLLSEREREILENHLVNEVAGHLHELLRAAEDQIDRMNRELAARRTSTGMQLRVRWRERADGPAELSATRRLMLRSDATWNAADRRVIGGFLQARISDVRQADPTGSWQEHLEQALDYRQWHSFVVERLQNGQWRSASGPASGGEKVLAVSVPLFAAASAHYNSAGSHAPRLILLDEAFAGVDDDSRAKSLGLLATFDLDVVMTSEREWGCYPQVPGLSIAQLSRIEGVDAVGVTRWRWDGQRRERGEEVAEAARATVRPAPPAPDQAEASLFE
ncbi:MAG TPA: TIGR02680 family protein [Nocardioidaceae bacterium]|nr:TIGR02680 family protein [Nocardioidaceae bacterium]